MIEFIAVFLLSYAWHMMGVTIGYHRLLSHRSFRCPKAVEYFWILGGYLAFEGSPIWWATMHRAHHKYVDTPLDPHSPQQGWYHAYIGWVSRWHYEPHINPDEQSKDLIKDKLYQFLECGGDWHKAHWVALAIGVGFRLVLLALFGWPVAIASALAGVIVLQVPLLLNLVCHVPKLGYKNFELEDDSVNVWWVALLTCGEGWHNNHHRFPGSAKSGMRWHEFDMSWITLRFMKALGMVSWINEAKMPKKPLPVVQPAMTVAAVEPERVPVGARK
jgi:sn-1 stearoyl-lipid 9-desaturase